MNKSDLADRLGGSAAAARNAVDGEFEAIGEALANGDEVGIFGFGTFGTRNRPARSVRNPGTGEQVEIAATTAPVFKAGKMLKDAVNARDAE